MTRNKEFLSFKMGQPRPLFVYFWSFQANVTIFTTNQCKKMSIQYMATGIEPTTSLEYESSPITTRPGLPLLAIKNYL